MIPDFGGGGMGRFSKLTVGGVAWPAPMLLVLDGGGSLASEPEKIV